MKRISHNITGRRLNNLLGFVFATLLLNACPYHGMSQKMRDVSLPGISNTYIYPDSRLNLIHFRENNPLQANTFFTAHKDLTGLRSEDEMRLLHEKEGTAGIIHSRFEQYYKGIKLENISYSLHERNGMLAAGLGKIIRGLNLDVAPGITEQQAINLAIAAVPADKYYWEEPAREERLRQRHKDPNATYYPEPELMICKMDPAGDFTPENYRLMYRVPVMASQPHQTMMVYLDAKTGDLIRKKSTMLNCSAGSVNTTFNGTHTIYSNFTGSTYESVDDCIYSIIYSYDDNTGNPVTDADNNWTNNSTSKQLAINSLWAVREATNYYATVHNLIGFDGEGDNVEIYNGYTYDDQPCIGCNSSWEWWTDNMYIGYGQTASQILDDYNTIDICGHELTHGVIEESTDIDYDGESGAINESFADIFGNVIEYSVENPSNDDWWGIAEDRSGPDIDDDGFRNMADPSEDGQPDTYFGNDWFYDQDDNSEYVHRNSGVGNYAFYLMSEGGSGVNDNGEAYDVQGMTHLTARFIAFDAMYHYADGDPTYEDIRDAYLTAANLLYGSCSQEAITVGKAWAAVGVGKYNNDYVFPLCGTYGNIFPADENAISVVRNRAYDFLNDEWLSTPCTATIEDNFPVTVHSAGYIQLEEGFVAKSGCDFTAYINACDITQLKIGETASGESLTGDDPQKADIESDWLIYPNPASNEVTLEFSLEKNTFVTLWIKDVSGRVISSIMNHEEMQAGKNKISANLKDLTPGAYLIDADLDGFRMTKKLIVQ